MAAPASADHTIVATDFALTASDHQAGASPNASSWTTLTYPGSPNTDDVKKTIGHFAPGMVANPEAVPHCKQELYLADACPADTRIGESVARIHVLPPAGPVIEEPGRIYNQELLGDEAGRLGIIVDTAPTKTFLTAPFHVRTNGDYGLDGMLDDLPRTIAGIGDIQVVHLGFTLYGTVQGRNYTRASDVVQPEDLDRRGVRLRPSRGGDRRTEHLHADGLREGAVQAHLRHERRIAAARRESASTRQ